MSVVTDIRKSVTEATPVLALVGATDLAVAQVRKVAGDAGVLPQQVEGRISKLQGEVEKAVAALDPDYLQRFFAKNLSPRAVQANAQQAPALAVSRALEVAGKVETGYEHLAERGKQVIERIEKAPATQDAVRQGKATVSRSKAAVTTAKRAADDTAQQAKATLTVGKREVQEVAADVEKTVTEGTKGTRAAVKRTATTARKRTATTRSASKGAATSARKASVKTKDAAESAAKTLGE